MPDQVAAAEERTPTQQPVRSRSEIAKELFGNEYVGDVKPVQPIEPEAKPAPAKAEEDAKPDDAKKGEGEPVVEEPASESDVAPEEDVKPAPEAETGETPIATAAELVEHLQTNPEWFNGLKMSFNVDGTPTEATIGQLVESYQLEDAARNRLEAAKTIAQKESEAWSQKHQELEGQFRVVAELVKGAEADLVREAQAVDPQLRERDPAEWAARVTEFNAKRAHIEQMKRNVVDEYFKSVASQREQFDATKLKFREEQEAMLLDKLPDWRTDPQKAAVEKTEIADYLVRTFGYGPAELDNLLDHRQVLLARKALLYDKSRGKVETAKKRVATVPKIMKPGAPKAREQLANEKLEALKARSKRSGSLEDALAYRMAKRGVSR